MFYLYAIGSLVWSIGGGAALVWALSSWLGKVWAGRILEQDRKKYAEELEAVKEKHMASLSRLNGEVEAMNRRLQAELDKTTHVYRVQFEREFRALDEIWKAVSKLRSQISGLRRSMSLSLPDESRRLEELNERIVSFLEALGVLQHAIHDQGPFYGEEVYGEVEKLLMIAKREQFELCIDTRERFTPEWFADGEKNKAEFIAQADIVSKKMRDRLANLAVYRDSH